MNELFATAGSLLGKEVVVTLGLEDGSPVLAKGQLLTFSDWGEFTLRDEMGGIHYCWPMLKIRAKEEADD